MVSHWVAALSRSYCPAHRSRHSSARGGTMRDMSNWLRPPSPAVELRGRRAGPGRAQDEPGRREAAAAGSALLLRRAFPALPAVASARGRPLPTQCWASLFAESTLAFGETRSNPRPWCRALAADKKVICCQLGRHCATPCDGCGMTPCACGSEGAAAAEAAEAAAEQQAPPQQPEDEHDGVNRPAKRQRT
ncbi:hypothetical protein ABPG75_004545 [Micractinium tetrahymenae]